MTVDLEDRPTTNIKKITIAEAPRTPDLPFDPERDISQEMWEHMKKALAHYKITLPLDHFVPTAASMAILFPDRIDELGLDSEFINRLLEEKHTDREYLKILFSHDWARFNTSQTGLPTFEDIKSSLEEENLSSESYDEVFRAFILYPERFEEIRSLDNLKKSTFADRANMHFRGGFMTTGILALKLLNPGKDYLADMSSQQLKDTVKRFLSMYQMKTDRAPGRLSEWSLIHEFAALKMVLAQDIQMTPQGLQIIMPGAETPLTSSSQVPATKKY